MTKLYIFTFLSLFSLIIFTDVARNKTTGQPVAEGTGMSSKRSMPYAQKGPSASVAETRITSRLPLNAFDASRRTYTSPVKSQNSTTTRLHFFSDLAIWLACFIIPVIVGYFLYIKNREIPIRTVLYLFAAFIMTCGLTYMADALLFWWQSYEFNTAIHTGVAVASAGTVITLLKVISGAKKKFRDPTEYQQLLDQRTRELLELNEQLTQEVDQRRQVEKELIRMNEMFESAQNAAGMGAWAIDLTTRDLYWSDKVYEIHEIEVGTEVNIEEAINFYHPDHRAIIEKAVDSSIQEGREYNLELKLITKKGRDIWVNAIGLPVMENGRTIRLQGLFQDITKRKITEEEERSLNVILEEKVRERTIQLEAANKELEAFSYSVSHDLRSPLRSINGFSQALMEDCYETLDEQCRSYLSRISRSAVRMGMLIDAMLNLSRISRKELVRSSVDLTTMSREVFHDLELDQKYTIDIQPGLFTLGDEKLVRIILENLIGNAAKYSSKIADPRIEVGACMDSSTTVFFIRDNGAGFDMRYADRLFEAFQRLHSQNEFEGTGVGLATVQRIINKHGGRIRAESQSNKGATFYFTLN